MKLFYVYIGEQLEDDPDRDRPVVANNAFEAMQVYAAHFAINGCYHDPTDDYHSEGDDPKDCDHAFKMNEFKAEARAFEMTMPPGDTPRVLDWYSDGIVGLGYDEAEKKYGSPVEAPQSGVQDT